MVGVPTPSRRFPVTWRTRYLASSGVAAFSSPASRSSFWPCEPVPSALAIWRRVFTTVTTVSSAGRPTASRGQQLLGGLAQVAGLAHPGGHVDGVDAGGGGDRADGHLLGQPEVHPGELRRDQALAQVAHHRQEFGRSLLDEGGQTLDQRQPTAHCLQVTVRLGDDLVLHGAPFAASGLTIGVWPG